LHERSRSELGRLRTESLKTLVAYSTLQECYTLVLHKLGIAEAHSFLKYVARTAIFVNPTAEDFDAATARILGYPDQDISLADAVLVELGSRLGIPVWTHDYHFDVMGARVWRG
jgi:predicted nucleic acid-binding protein